MKIFITMMATAMGSRIVEPVFWRVDNEMFSTTENYSRHVQLQDKMDIFCPQFESVSFDDDSRTFSKSHHYQTIFMVDEYSFHSCRIGQNAKKLMSCEKPNRVKKYTMKFQEVNPNPYGLEFSADGEYFFISTSNGNDIGSIGQVANGVCAEHGMKLRIKVHRGEDLSGVRRIADAIPEERMPTFSDYQAYEDVEREVAEDNFAIMPEVEKQTGANNVIIVGAIVGTFLVILVLVAILLTKRIFENRKGSQSYPTLSDYQSSYVEKYDFPQFANHQGSPQTLFSNSFSPPLSPVPIGTVSLIPKNFNLLESQKIQKISDEFSYIEGNRLSNRTNDIVLV